MMEKGHLAWVVSFFVACYQACAGLRRIGLEPPDFVRFAAPVVEVGVKMHVTICISRIAIDGHAG